MDEMLALSNAMNQVAEKYYKLKLQEKALMTQLNTIHKQLTKLFETLNVDDWCNEKLRVFKETIIPKDVNKQFLLNRSFKELKKMLEEGALTASIPKLTTLQLIFKEWNSNEFTIPGKPYQRIQIREIQQTTPSQVKGVEIVLARKIVNSK